MKKFELTSKTIKWNVVDGFGVRAILTTVGFNEQEVRDLKDRYMEDKESVDIESFNIWLEKKHCLSNQKYTYITYL